MKETNYNIVQGDTWSLTITYTDSIGTPINLNGASALMQVRDQPGGRIVCASATAYSSSPSLNDGMIITASAGKIDITISADKTRKFNLPKSAYQVQLTNSSGANTTLLKGWFNVDAGVID